MTPDAGRKYRKFTPRALELEESERKAYLEEACADDESLRGEVESCSKPMLSGKFYLTTCLRDVALMTMIKDSPSLIGRISDITA